MGFEIRALFFPADKDKDANRCWKLFYSSSDSGDIREKHKFQNQLDVYFCYSLYLKEFFAL